MPLNQAPATAIPRPLGTLEKLFWLADQNRPTHFAIIAEVGGSTRTQQWQDALDRVCRQSALIWSRIVPDQRGAPVFTPVPCGSIPLRVVENAMSEWTAHVAGQLDQPFDASRAPLLRATLLHGADRSVIILCAHHSMADGLALSFLMRDVLRVRRPTGPAQHRNRIRRASGCRRAQYLGDARGGSNSYSKAADAVPATGRVNTAGGGRASHAGDDAIPARAGAG